MATTAACANEECPEFGVPKDMRFLPPDYPDPVFCGACGDVIDVSDVELPPDPEPKPA